MDVTTDQLIEIALNMAGFMAGGALMVVLGSMFRRRRPRQAEVPVQAEPVKMSVEETPLAPRTETTRMQFIKFGETAPGRSEAADSSVGESSPANPVRRNRAEVLRLAREMIAAKQPREKIARSLPVSEAELAMLSNEQ